MEYIIRRATEDDWPEIKRIYEAGINTGLATFETEAPSHEKWGDEKTTACRIVIESEQQILGFCKLSRVSLRAVYSGVGEVSIYVDPTQFGKGIGQQIMHALIQASEQQGFWTLEAKIFPENSASLRLHLKNGFREVGFRERIGKRDGVWRDNILLERRSSVNGIH
ncbi:GNAT family N-acetyltransferase [Planococcus sp. ISL-109]|uniref:GNAT family N-acetyltransferase n=1 Tax=Planococcus sp. ISL-109 TaxID=2819166 RepID=UPI001BE9C0EC|nr:GNAT family N-acetyltransferase [Planococcus sp. ISL-109]MBT2581606.1 N-acetyltransferase [Planococcus sp. ISL-109]